LNKSRLVLLLANLALIASFLGTWSDGG
jgi:hypothetical protein